MQTTQLIYFFYLLLCAVCTLSKVPLIPASSPHHFFNKHSQETSIFICFVLLISVPFTWHILFRLHPVTSFSILGKWAYLVCQTLAMVVPFSYTYVWLILTWWMKCQLFCIARKLVRSSIGKKAVFPGGKW